MSIKVTLECKCGWKRGFMVETEIGYQALRQHVKYHTELHEKYGDHICPRCKEAPLSPAERVCEWCFDKECEIRHDMEDSMRERDYPDAAASELDDAQDANEMRCRDE